MFFFFPLRDEYKVKRFPVVVISIISINCFVYFLTGYSPYYREIILKYGFIPAKPSLLTAITSMFLHGGILHLGFNMWYLFLTGDNIEDRWGRLNFLIFYIVGGIFSVFLYSVLIPHQYDNIPLIGASGAIAAVLGAYTVLFPKALITFKYFFWLIIFIKFGEFKLYASFWLALWFLQQAFYTFMTKKFLIASSVAFAAHFAGFLYGMIIGIGTKLFKEARYRENVTIGKNILFNMLGGEREKKLLTFEQMAEVDELKNKIKENFEKERVLASDYYVQLLNKYTEKAVVDERMHFGIAKSLENQGKIDEAIECYKNFLLNYPFSKLADDALISLGKIYFKKGEYEKAKNCFLQIVLFYPYSNSYEEAKFYLEKKLPEILHSSVNNCE